MATCYRCGRPITPNSFRLRRKVKTGETIHRRYPNPNISALRTTFGIRVVCATCAHSIDRAEALRNWRQLLELLLALLVLVVFLAIRLWSSVAR
jgi:hypothetical protein